VGKSALIEKLLANNTKPLYGYFTRSTPAAENGFHSIYMYRAGEKLGVMAEENHIGDCNGRERTVHPEVFETLGVEYLKAAPDGVIAMDEIGFMELESPMFCKAIRAHLDGDIHVLGSVKARTDIDFLNEIREHPKAAFYEVTEENRDALYEKLLPVIMEWNQE